MLLIHAPTPPTTVAIAANFAAAASAVAAYLKIATPCKGRYSRAIAKEQLGQGTKTTRQCPSLDVWLL